MKHRNTKRQSGFTLFELMIVIVLIALVGASLRSFVGGGATSGGYAMQYYTFAQRATDSFGQLVAVGRISPDPTDSNPFFEGSNNLLDVLVGGEDMVADNYKLAYRRAGLSTIEDSVQVVTFPTSGTPGSYTLGGPNNELTVTYGGGREILWNIANVSSDVIESLIEDHEPSSEFDTSGDSTSRRIRYTAETGGMHTLTIVQRVR